MQEANEIGRIRIGERYRFHQLRRVLVGGERVWEDVPLGLYRVQAIAADALTYREVVVYHGVSGPDDGKWFVCSLYDFALKFRPEPVEQPALEQPA